LADVTDFLTSLALSYGYLGVFAASLLGSVVPFVPIPYLIVVVLLSSTLDPLTLGVVAGLGGALGKVTSYVLGRSGYLISNRGTQKNLEFLGRFARKWGDLGVFIFAATPLPDDVLYVPMGMVKFPLLRFMLANAAGKVVLATAVAYLGRASFLLAAQYLGTSELATAVPVVVLTVAVTVLLTRADWALAYSKYQSGGLTGVIQSAGEILRLGPKSAEDPS